MVKHLGLVSSQRPLWMVLGLFALGLGVGVGMAFAAALPFGLRGANASHLEDGVVHACVNRATGQARFIMPGRTPNCTPAEVQMDLGSGSGASDLDVRVAALEEQMPACLSEDPEGTAVFEGCNVQIVNGEGATGTMNGKGNLIIGYNESFLGEGKDRSGSHNLVVGPEHQYSGSAGLVAGYNNTISARWATVTGGAFNSATADGSTVIGGYENSVNTENGIAP